MVWQLIFYKTDFEIQTQFDFLNWFGLLLIFIVSANFGKVNCSSAHFFIGLILYFTFIFAVSYFNKIPVFQHLPLYENYLDILSHRFKGLSNNTNNFSLGLFCSFALYVLLSDNKQLDRWDVAIYIVVICAFIFTLGRHGLISVSLIPIAYLAKRGAIKWIMAISVFLIIILLLSLRVNIIPLKYEFPFLNIDSSTYSLVHDTYLNMTFNDGKVFGLPDEISEQKYKLYVNEENYAKIIAQRGKTLDSMNTFMPPHSIFLELATKFGLLSFILYISICINLFIKMGKSVRSTVGAIIVVLHVLSCLFIGTSRISWLFLFCLNVYAISRNNRSPAPIYH